VSGEPETEGRQIRELLLRQITAQVRWTDYIIKLKALGVAQFIEVGPGDVLTRLGKRIDRALEFLAYAQVMR
jgi:[acyl-carrier-protein] S-malonyltransferase